MTKTYWKCILSSGNGGFELGEHQVVVYAEKTDDQYPDADFIEITVNKRFKKPDGGPYVFLRAITVDLNENHIKQLNLNPAYLV